MKMKQKSKNLRESAIEIREGKACLINCKAEVQVQSKPISFERSSIDLRRPCSYSRIFKLQRETERAQGQQMSRIFLLVEFD